MSIALEIGQKLDSIAGTAKRTRDHVFGTGPHSVAFPDETVSAMWRDSTVTRSEGKERGFHFCIDPTKRVEKSITPGVKLPEKALSWAVLNTAPTCSGDLCSVNINQGCPDVLEEVDITLSSGASGKGFRVSPGMAWGTWHTHPNRASGRPSVGDKLSMLDDAVYQNGPAFGCVTALPEAWDPPDSWYKHGNYYFTDEQNALHKRTLNEYGPDRPTRCYVVPDNRLPSTGQLNWWREKYHRFVRPYYDEWRRAGKQPGKEDYPDFDKFWKAYNEIDKQTDELIAWVEFDDVRNMKNILPHSVQQNHIYPDGYFAGYDVALAEVEDWFDTYTPPPIAAPPKHDLPVKSTFDEIFETLANCGKRKWADGSEMSITNFLEIVSLNDLEQRHPDGSGKTVGEVCRELSDLGDVWIYGGREGV